MITASSEYKNILKTGFTLLEIMISITIIGLLFTAGLARYMDFNKTQTLKSSVLDLKNNLRDIQAKANSGVKPTGCTGTFIGYVVHYISTTQYNVYADCITTNGAIKTYTLIAGTKFNASFADITFLALNKGVSPAPTTITIKHTVNNKTVNLNITASGEIYD